jgi:hypothetical protein
LELSRFVSEREGGRKGGLERRQKIPTAEWKKMRSKNEVFIDQQAVETMSESGFICIGQLVPKSN